MDKGWLELESDPGLFSLLLEDFGVKGVQVEEVYDLQKRFEGKIYGFIFLFKWIEERRSRRKVIKEEELFVVDDEVVNSMFFAKQIVANSCATHALLSVLLNSGPASCLGEMLSHIKSFTSGMNPEDKGFAIGNMPDLARAHNSHARPEPLPPPEKSQTNNSTVRTAEAFHYVSYVPVCGRLFELDGLKPYPIDHGPWAESEEWTEKFRRVISERLGMATGCEAYHDIRYNLMAVVPEKGPLFENKLSTLKTNRQIVLDALHQMIKMSSQTDLESPPKFTSVRRETRFTRSRASIEATELEVDDAARQRESLENAVSLAEADLADMKCDVKIKVTHSNDPCPTSAPDVTSPLVIQTRFSSNSAQGGGDSDSTDTASEMGSSFNSPVSSTKTMSAQSSPNNVAGPPGVAPLTDDDTQVLAQLQSGSSDTKLDGKMPAKFGDGRFLQAPASELKRKSSESEHSSSRARLNAHRGFTPKDLLALLKKVDNEISMCESNLKDEIEKKKRYQVDACRRTHNYDQFLCTFLSMLAEQGHLSSLVEKHSALRLRSNNSSFNVGCLPSLSKSSLKKKNSKKRK